MSALDQLKQDLTNHLVKIALPGEMEMRTLSLIVVRAKTSILKDIQFAYTPNKTQNAMANKIFGQEEAENQYGVFVDPEELKYLYAFNTAFARYDRKSQRVVFTDLDDFLLKSLDQMGTPPSELPSASLEDLENRIEELEGRPPTYYYGSEDVTFKYAVTEKVA